MPKYLLLSDSPALSTGFRHQTFLLAERLAAENNELFWLAPTHLGMPVKNATLLDGRKIPATILGGAGGHPHAVHALPRSFSQTKPDIFYCLLDSFMLVDPRYRPNILELSIPAKSCLWFPSDGGFFPHQCEHVLRKFDYPVAMSKWGRDQVKRQFNIDATYIPHGVKTQLFYPLSDEKKKVLRQEYSRKLGRDLSRKFIVGCVARNQPRKFMDRLIKAFTLFAKGKDDVLLLMHSDPNDPAQPFPITELVNRCTIGHKIAWTGMTADEGFPDNKMYEIYNLFDVKLDTTSGEGFGITLIESMACGIPPIVTDFTTTKEIVTDNKAGLAIKLIGEEGDLYDGRAETVDTNQTIGGWLVERAFADIRHAAKLLNDCYEDWKKGGTLLKEMGENGRKAVLESYDFDNCVYPAWRKLFERMLS